MTPRDPDSESVEFPNTVSFTKDGQTVRYHRQMTRACVDSARGRNLDADLQVVGEIDDERVVVETTAAQVRDLITSGDATAAYDYEGGPVSFVPTGRVFVRVGTDEALSNFEQDFLESGYVIQEQHSRFEFAGWLVAASGRQSEALQQCEALANVNGLDNFEPEMLSASVKR